jgi:hypothetical protein
MPIQVQGPDGQLLEFPDGTSRETMKAAMQKRYGGRTDTGIGQLVSGQRKPAAYRAADKVGMGNVLGAVDAVQHHVLNIPESIGQGAAHGVNWLIQHVAPGTDYAKGVQARLDA